MNNDQNKIDNEIATDVKNKIQFNGQLLHCEQDQHYMIYKIYNYIATAWGNIK